jgi:hypothetical protein
MVTGHRRLDRLAAIIIGRSPAASLTPDVQSWLAEGTNDTNDALGLGWLSSDRDYHVRTKGYFCSIIQTPFHSSAGGFAW